MKKYYFVLKKGEMISFYSKNRNSGCVFNHLEEVYFEITFEEIFEDVVYCEFVYKANRFSMFKFYADRIRLEDREFSVKDFVEQEGVLINE